VAGALAVQLGGLNYYFGKPSMRPTLGNPIKEMSRKDIVRANALMLVTMILAAIGMPGCADAGHIIFVDYERIDCISLLYLRISTNVMYRAR
jgi:hypothetical protein